MKLTRSILTLGAIALATFTIEPGFVNSAVPSAIVLAVANPLAVLKQRSPGMRDDGTTIDTKRKRDWNALAEDAASTHYGPGGASEPFLGPDGDRGPLTPSADGPIAGGSFGGGDADAGSVSNGGGGFGGWGGPSFVGGPGGGGGGGGSGHTGGGSTGGGSTGGGSTGGGTTGGDTGGDSGNPGGGGSTGGGTTGGGTIGGGGGGPVIPTPEPGTWAMLILGFAFTGAAMRRTRRSAAKAAV